MLKRSSLLGKGILFVRRLTLPDLMRYSKKELRVCEMQLRESIQGGDPVNTIYVDNDKRQLADVLILLGK